MKDQDLKCCATCDLREGLNCDQYPGGIPRLINRCHRWKLNPYVNCEARMKRIKQIYNQLLLEVSDEKDN